MLLRTLVLIFQGIKTLTALTINMASEEGKKSTIYFSLLSARYFNGEEKNPKIAYKRLRF